MIIIDGKGLILGRMGTFVAKKALLGEDVVILNSKEVIISGKKEEILSKFRNLRKRGIHTKGPFYPRRSDFMLKRLIRGMFPIKTTKGRNAFKSLKCYITVPLEFQGKETITVTGAKMSKLPNLNYITIGEICQHLGGKQ
jgi:large subunit ribosomal protein L13